jgi:hypothetical protein
VRLSLTLSVARIYPTSSVGQPGGGGTPGMLRSAGGKRAAAPFETTDSELRVDGSLPSRLIAFFLGSPGSGIVSVKVAAYDIPWLSGATGLLASGNFAVVCPGCQGACTCCLRRLRAETAGWGRITALPLPQDRALIVPIVRMLTASDSVQRA